jgi:hypothetical protein
VVVLEDMALKMADLEQMAKGIMVGRVLHLVTAAAAAKAPQVPVVQQAQVVLENKTLIVQDQTFIMPAVVADRVTNATVVVLAVELAARVAAETDPMLQVEVHQEMAVSTQVAVAVEQLVRTMQVLLYLDQVDLELL